MAGDDNEDVRLWRQTVASIRESKPAPTYNLRLEQAKDPRRLLRLASYDDREIVMLLKIATATKLYIAGAGHIFEDPSKDLEPNFDAPSLVTVP